MIQVGVLKETTAEEFRVAAVPESVAKMLKAKMDVFIEKDAGLASYIPDSEYQKAGANIENSAAAICKKAKIILRVTKPSINEINAMQSGTILIGPMAPSTSAEEIKQLSAKKMTAFALELLPRIARAQSMDILSSMSNLTGKDKNI